MLRSTLTFFSLGNKSSAAPFAGAALQLIDLQKQHFNLVLGEKKRRDREKAVYNKINNPKDLARHKLKSVKKYEAEQETLQRLRKEYEEQGGVLPSANDDKNVEENYYHHDNNDFKENNFTLKDSIIEEDEQLLQSQEDAEELKAEFLEKLEELRPMFHATKALSSSRLYSIPLYRSLKYFKLYDDPLFLQLSSVLGALDKSRDTRKGNNLMFWGEENNSTADHSSYRQNSYQNITKRREDKFRHDMKASKFDDNEDDMDYTNVGDLSNMHGNTSEDEDDDDDDQQQVEEFLKMSQNENLFGDEFSSYKNNSNPNNNKKISYFGFQQATEGKSAKREILFKNLDEQMKEQQEEYRRHHQRSNLCLSSLSAIQRREIALDQLKSRKLPFQLAENTPSEYPAPNPDAVAEASSGELVHDMGVAKTSYAHRGHWILRERGIAASKNTRAMDPW